MWTDEGRLLAHLREAAEKSVEGLENGARLSAVERTAASAVRFACRNYCNKRPDIIVVGASRNHRSRKSAAPAAREGGRDAGGWDGRRVRDEVSTSRANRATTPSGVRPLRRSDGPKGDGGETDTFGRTRRISESKARGREG